MFQLIYLYCFAMELLLLKIQYDFLEYTGILNIYFYASVEYLRLTIGLTTHHRPKFPRSEKLVKV